MAQTFKGIPGDLIEISRESYQQWAVYIGGKEVIHLVTEGGQSSGSSANPGNSNTGKVKREKLTDVVGNDNYQVKNLLDDMYDARKLSVIVKKAREMVGRVLQYNVVTYNSEHFAIEMRYGKAESRQFKGKPGDLIEIFCLGYKHWAVYIGENEVVHLVNEGDQSSGSLELLSSSNGKVKREKLTNVVAIPHFQVNNLLDEEYDARYPSIIVKEACEMVGRVLQYNVDTYNSEHFAIEMRYGVAESRQFNGKPGDLIEIFLGPCEHWAVYIGENEVVHLVKEGGGKSSGSSANQGSSNGKVKREKLTDVVGNDNYQVNNLLDERFKACDPSIIVKKAREMVGRVLQYNVVNNNCEHFATEMRYGVAESRQFNGKPGDLIEIYGEDNKQWAVYIGENEVVHLVNEGVQSSGSSELLSSSNGKVKREKLTDVVGNDRYHSSNLKDDMYYARDPSIIVKEACEMVGRVLQYDVVSYNCEHFATDLRYGKAESRQFIGKPGDLIEISRRLYKHWAIYIGQNEVVHLVNQVGLLSCASANPGNSNTGKVLREKLTEVVGHDRFKVNNLLDEEYDARDPSVIVKKACEMVGQQLQYDLVNKNCEHFATDLRYGTAVSRQVKKAIKTGLSVLAISSAISSAVSVATAVKMVAK